MLLFLCVKPVKLKQSPITRLCHLVPGLFKTQTLRISFRTSEIILILHLERELRFSALLVGNILK